MGEGRVEERQCGGRRRGEEESREVEGVELRGGLGFWRNRGGDVMDCDIIERIAASGGLANIQSRDLLPLFFGLARPEKCLRKSRRT